MVWVWDALWVSTLRLGAPHQPTQPQTTILQPTGSLTLFSSSPCGRDTDRVCVCALQVSWTSPRMTLGGSARGGEASCCVVPYSSSRPCRCSGSRSPCPRGRSTLGRASRPCFPRGTTRDPSRATGSCGTRWRGRAARPASSSCEVTHWLLSRFL